MLQHHLKDCSGLPELTMSSMMATLACGIQVACAFLRDGYPGLWDASGLPFSQGWLPWLVGYNWPPWSARCGWDLEPDQGIQALITHCRSLLWSVASPGQDGSVAAAHAAIDLNAAANAAMPPHNSLVFLLLLQSSTR